MREYMKRLGEAVNLILPSKDGNPEPAHRCEFVLILTDDEGLTNFVSDCDPVTILSMMAATAAKIEDDPEDVN